MNHRPCLELPLPSKPAVTGLFQPWHGREKQDSPGIQLSKNHKTQLAISGNIPFHPRSVIFGIVRMAPLNVRVIVRVPLNRPEDSRLDPPKVEWNQDKEKVLWDVIARSRATDNGGTDWPGLAAHLQVPLPYLLYRAQTRYEEDLRGLQGIRVALSPTNPDPSAASPSPDHLTARPTPVPRLSSQITSTRLTTPLGLRARLNSLTPAPPNATPKVSSSSILTLQDGPPARLLRRPTVRSRSSSAGSDDDSDAELDASEQAERQLEQQEALDQKLRNLQTMITGDKLGLVRSSRPRQRTERPSRDPHRALSNYTSLDSSSPSTSSVGSPQGSIPSIPSPPPEQQQVQQPGRRHNVSAKSPSPPVLSPRHVHPQGFGGLIGTVHRNSERDSNNGSSASSFSDLSGQSSILSFNASLSASTMENDFVAHPTIAPGPSRLTTLARDSFRRGSRAFQR
ncbi:hypothetical protein BDM02DRAFT_3184266 [Thelephora ganbajun]|uniref:Uncharacterized protein n=1 Tax=Thelephora ganbajun TaxID=370292 RepID=A0ACB6ZQA1_THEGA|nr:hypothetical protein BDM02DRAFT_3184266 [Thelephora ganbajun]